MKVNLYTILKFKIMCNISNVLSYQIFFEIFYINTLRNIVLQPRLQPVFH